MLTFTTVHVLDCYDEGGLQFPVEYQRHTKYTAVGEDLFYDADETSGSITGNSLTCLRSVNCSRKNFPIAL
jgi:hypothetical protein